MDPSPCPGARPDLWGPWEKRFSKEKLHTPKSAFVKYLNWLDTKNTSLSAVVTVFWKTTPNLHQLLSNQSLFNTIYSNGRTIWYHFPRPINAFCLDFLFVTWPQIIKFLFAPQKRNNFGAKTGRCSFLLDLGLGQSNLWDYLHYQHIVNLWSYPRICEIFSPEGRKVGNPISE